MKDKGEMVNVNMKDKISLKSASLGRVPMKKLEDWDLANNNISLAKMQQKLQQTLNILDKIPQ